MGGKITRPSLGQASAIAGILGSLAAVVAVVASLGDGGTATAPAAQLSQTPTSTSPASAPGTSAEDRLLSYVPAGIRTTCATPQPLPAGTLASVACSLASTAGVRYSLYPDTNTMYAVYNPTAVEVAPGSCASAWNVQSSYQAQGKEEVGLLKCYDVDGKSWMEWTRDDLRVYAVTSRSDLKRRVLFKAWNSAGPVGPVTGVAGTSTPE